MFTITRRPVFGGIITSAGCAVIASIALFGFWIDAGAQSPAASMSFFVTSAGSGKGADFGGLEGADKHCQTLATAAGAVNKTVHVYVSTQEAHADKELDSIY